MVAWKAVALTTVAVLALTRAASAADLLPPPPSVEPPPPPPVFSADLGGWYLRGDVGVGVNNNADLTSTANAGGGGDSIYNSSVSESALIDLGVGYQFNNWFRVDVTGELRGGSTFQGLEVCNNCGVTPPGQNQYSDFYRGNLSSAIGLVNGYANLGSWYGLTPFVGAGVGFAVNRTSGATDTGSAYLNPTGNSWQNYGVGGYFSNSTKVNLAWALMAGVDMDVTRNLKLELGYRFLDYGKFTTGGANCLQAGAATGFATPACGYKVASKELYSNDVRIGLRYYFDTPAPAPDEPAPAPLVRKY
jgi:opacity protein-like surface antigen